jgi:aspartyl-tRNA(Asn)/glutamyl-tRNA(Gln) amidotransferase subunit A
MTSQIAMGVTDLARAYADGSLSPVDATEEALRRIEAHDGELRSFLGLRAEEAIREAREAEREMRSGQRRGPLHGVPVAVKDLIDIDGMPTTAGSVSRRDDPPRRDAEMVRHLRRAGAILLGKNNLYEFGLGLPSDGEWPAAARNPWDLDRIPGGSSSGSAVAVSARLCAGSFGTDTGGSIRGPASYCGIVGMKPTYGLISTTGCMALSWTLDHVGPMGNTVDDVAALLAGASGLDVIPGAPTRPPRVGVPSTLVEQVTMEPDVARTFEEAVRLFERGGSAIRSVEVPDLELTEAALLAIIGSEGLAVHLSTLGSMPERYGRSARERLTAGLVYTGADYVNAMRYRDVVFEAFERIYEEVDLMLSPVTLQVAPTNAEFQRNPPHRTPFTGVHNLLGAPAISVPAGFDRAGMPIGIQIAGPPGADGRALATAAWFERETGWAGRTPAVTGGGLVS